MANYLNILSYNIVYYRKKHLLSQTKLSEDAFIQRTYLNELEHGQRNPSIVKIYQLSIALRIKPYYLLRDISKNSITSVELEPAVYHQTVDIYMINLIKSIKILHRHFNYNQKDLAQLSGLSESFIRTIEQGRKEPTLASLDKISTAFNLPLWKLIKGVDFNSIWLCHDMWI